MKNRIYLILLLISTFVFSQQRTIEITNIKTGKVKFFEENQRIKIRTLDRKKHIGMLKFQDGQTIIIKDKSIKIDSLQSIKNQPKGLATVKTVVLAAGLATVASSLFAASKGDDSAFMLFTVGTGTTIGAGLLEGVNANYTERKWKFKIIDSSLKGEPTKQK
jgi:hypothetical protein